MKNNKPYSFFAALTLLFMLNGITLFSFGQTSAYKPKDQKLYHEIRHMDSIMFMAFNQQDINTLKKVFAKDVEFYNDGGGITNYQNTMDNFKVLFDQNKTTGLRRELVEGSLEVYPVKDFGAIELGTHRFIHTENGKEEIGTMKFIQIWKNENGQWTATRVISIGH